MTFRIGAPDAEILPQEFFPQFGKQDFLNLPKYQIYLRLMIDGIASGGFSAITLPPHAAGFGASGKIIKVSRQKYGLARYKVEMGMR